MERTEFDVLVIGAGAAGLMGALEIALAGRTVAVIEAKNKTGGRIETAVESGYSAERGAEFVHGNLPLTKQLLQNAGAKTYTVNGSFWQYKKGRLQEQEDFIDDFEALDKKFKALEEDKSVAAFLQEDLAGESNKNLRFSIRNYVEGYYAADITDASTAALRDELTKGDKEQYRIIGGYQQLVAYLEEQCREAGVRIFLSQAVLQLQWKKGAATAITEKSAFMGQKALITVSIGVLQQEAISFSPALPRLKSAVQSLGFGHVLKLLFRFDDRFWTQKKFTREKDLADMSFLFSEEEIPTWWTHFPKNDAMLTGWLGGLGAKKYRFLSTDDIQRTGLEALGRIFDVEGARLQQKLTKMHFYNWSADPHFCGAYSYKVVGGEKQIREIQQPVEETLFFAGEGLHPGPEIGTVEGALQSGREAARRLCHGFSA